MRPRLAPTAARMAISLVRPSARREQQIGEIGAGDEQHTCDGAEQDEEAPSHIGHEILLERHDEGAPTLVIGRVQPFKPL